MRLTDLKPRWVVGHRWDTPNGTQHLISPNATQGRYGMGISFDCPVHRTHRLAVFFSNPVDGLPPEYGANLWKRDGETFEALSLSPSIDTTTAWPGCWHGFITSGEIT